MVLNILAAVSNHPIIMLIGWLVVGSIVTLGLVRWYGLNCTKKGRLGRALAFAGWWCCFIVPTMMVAENVTAWRSRRRADRVAKGGR